MVTEHIIKRDIKGGLDIFHIMIRKVAAADS